MQTPHQPTSTAFHSLPAAPSTLESVPLREQLSALTDNQCDMVDWDALYAAYTESAQAAELRQAWADYHLIGELLRARVPASGVGSAAFVAGVMAKVAEVAEVAEVAQETQRLAAVPPRPAEVAAPVAANDAVFRWKMVAGFASFAAVAAVLWQLVAAPALPVGPQVAAAAPPPDTLQLVVTPAGSVMIRDPQLDELMAAHRQWGGVSALQVPAGFLRSATYEPAPR